MHVYLNGQIMPASEAKVSVFDRGFIFGDGVYEGLRSTAFSGRRRVIGLQRHLRRLREGLAAIGMRFDGEELVLATEQLLDAEAAEDAFVYWQVTRGVPPLDGSAPVRARVPSPGTTPTVFAYATPMPPLRTDAAPALKRASRQVDRRWLNGFIKSISLLGNVQAMMAADAAHAEEAVLIRDGVVTEGTYTNIAVVINDHGKPGAQRILTPSLSSAPLLAGVTRQILVDHVPEIEECAVPAVMLDHAQEILLFGTTTMVTSVTHLDGQPVGPHEGPGPVAKRLLATLTELIRSEREDVG